MRRNIWILGGTGYIGQQLVRYLSESSNYLLHLLVHRHIPYRELENHSLFEGNLEDFDWSWLEKYPPAVIFHLARLGGSHSITRSLSARKGAMANERLVQYLLKMPHPPILVYVSGSLMYGPQEEGVFADENVAWNPVAFARYYFTGEKPLLNAQYSGPLDIRFARPGWIVGNGSWLKTFYINHYIRSGQIPLYGDGKQLMSLIHLKDCVRQIVRLAQEGEYQQNLNIFAGRPVTQQEFAELLARELNADIEPVSLEQLQKLYGPTVTEALTSSIPMKTVYPVLNNPNLLQYPDVLSIVKSISLFFEHKQGVFTESP